MSPLATIFSMTLAGLPAFFSSRIAFSRASVSVRNAGEIEGDRIGRRDMHRQHPAEGLQLVRLAGRFERHHHADLAEAGRDLVVHVGADHTVA